MRKTYINETHKAIINAIENAGLQIKKPIMLTANQLEDSYAVTMGWCGTSIRIPKEYILDEEIKEITDDDLGGRVILNKIFECKL